jgi:hypothetical protein
MADRNSTVLDDPPPTDPALDEVEPGLTSPEDVASAGRSCMAIVVLGAIIIILLVVWVVYRAFGE